MPNIFIIWLKKWHYCMENVSESKKNPSSCLTPEGELLLIFFDECYIIWLKHEIVWIVNSFHWFETWIIWWKSSERFCFCYLKIELIEWEVQIASCNLMSSNSVSVSSACVECPYVVDSEESNHEKSHYVGLCEWESIILSSRFSIWEKRDAAFFHDDEICVHGKRIINDWEVRFFLRLGAWHYETVDSVIFLLL
jgi:hypothetical protein